MINLRAFYLISVLLFLNARFVIPQKLVQDSLILDLKANLPDSLQCYANIDSVFDIRNIADARFIQIDEINHYGVVPVDYHLKITKPLSQIIWEKLSFNHSKTNNRFLLGIKQFEFSKQSRFFFWNRFQLNVLLSVFEKTKPDTPRSMGELIYETDRTFFFKGKIKPGYEAIFQVWHNELIRDLKVIADNFNMTQPDYPYHFFKSRSNDSWLQLSTTGQFIFMPKAFLIDSYLRIAYPESKQLFWFFTSTLRYRHEKTFESIEYGLVNNYLNYRLNTNFMFLFRSNLFLGFNRWKNVKSVEHKIYDSLISDFSLCQIIQFYPLHKKTIILGSGMLQNVCYIYSQKFKFQIGLLVTVGMHL